MWGSKSFAYLSTGDQIDHPRFFRQEEQAGQSLRVDRRRVPDRAQHAQTAQA